MIPHSAISQLYPWLFVSALRPESSVILEQYRHSKEKIPQGYTLFRFPDRDMLLLEMGSGKRINLNKLKSAIIQLNPGLIINFGICGALHLRIKLNDNYLVKSIRYENKSEINLSTDLALLKLIAHYRSDYPAARLLTVRTPVLNGIKRDKLRRTTACDIVDMEAYFIAQIAHTLEIPVVILKQVTDYADHKTRKQILTSRKIWQESLRQGVAKILKI